MLIGKEQSQGDVHKPRVFGSLGPETCVLEAEYAEAIPRGVSHFLEYVAATWLVWLLAGAGTVAGLPVLCSHL